jgi:hypothetical protein
VSIKRNVQTLSVTAVAVENKYVLHILTVCIQRAIQLRLKGSTIIFHIFHII